MARRPANPHPLRQVRDAGGLGQIAFAQAVGTSGAVIHAIEHRQRSITPGLARRLLAFTGVYPPSLLDTDGATALDLNGNVYSAESFKNWKVRTGKLGTDEKNVIAQWLDRVRQVLNAAALENRLSGALFLLEERLETIATTLSLGDRIQELLQAELAVTKNFKVRDLRRDPGLAKMLGFKDSPELRDDDELKMRLAPELSERRFQPSIRSAINARWRNRNVSSKPEVIRSIQDLTNQPNRHIEYGGPVEMEVPLELTYRGASGTGVSLKRKPRRKKESRGRSKTKTRAQAKKRKRRA